MGVLFQMESFVLYNDQLSYSERIPINPDLKIKENPIALLSKFTSTLNIPNCSDN